MFAIRDVSRSESAFGASNGILDAMMPAYSSIPEEFKHGRTKWNKLFNDIFFNGLESLELFPKPGVDKDRAFRHIRAIMVSFAPKHEHKEAGVAFLFNEWFDDAKWQAKIREKT